MIKRLKSCQIEAKDQRTNQSQAFKRPFSMFSKNVSPSKSPARRSSVDPDEISVKSSPMNPPSFPASPSYPNLSNGDLSNSSWAEMETHLIGHFPIYPLTLSAKQVSSLRCLKYIVGKLLQDLTNC